jgi:hypothetical protein
MPVFGLPQCKNNVVNGCKLCAISKVQRFIMAILECRGGVYPRPQWIQIDRAGINGSTEPIGRELRAERLAEVPAPTSDFCPLTSGIYPMPHAPCPIPCTMPRAPCASPIPPQ